jgi:Flp pilus assembly CpaF family ATPase
MEIKFKGNSFIAEKSDFDNSQAKLMVLECRDCAHFSRNANFSINCVKCILSAIKQHKNLKFFKISLKYQEKLFGSGEIGDLKSYFLNQEKLTKELTKINSFDKCKYKEFECKIIDSLRYDIFDLKKFIDDPIHFYEKLNEIKNLINSDKIYDSVCESCLVKLEVHLNKIIEILHKFHIIKHYIEYKSESNLNNRTRFYQQLFQKDFIKSKKAIQKTYNFLKNKKIASYNIGNRNEYKICIFEINNESEKFYEYNLNLPQEFNGKYLKSLINDINLNFELIDINEIIQFEELLEIYSNKALEYIKHKYRISDNEAIRLALYASLRRLNLFKIFPFLIDDFVEEIFLDSPHEKLYLIHQKYGKCRTNISFNDIEVERMKTFIRIYSNQRLDYSSPSNKLVIKNKLFYCRIALDISPIVPNGFALDIRKLNKNIMTIQDLLKNNTLNPEMAAFIYFNVLRRVNFTVTGETNTGKTTLINALDLITPREFRKIYIEDITESLNQLKYGRHQLKFRVDSGAYTNQKFSKQNQIKTLLHRTPDIIYLGEILTKDEAKAMFHCLAAGLKGFQTIHANDLEALINRFLFHFRIDRSCLSDLDLLILMKNSNSQRKIVSISEVDKDNIHINEIFSYKPRLKKHKLKSDLFESKIISKLGRYEDISKESFFSILNVYEDIFSTLKKIKKINNEELVKLFDIISYLSFKSSQKIEKFWFNWKQRNLNPLN